MSKNVSTIVAVGATVDFAQLDDPSQTVPVLVKAAEEVLSAIRTTSFDDHAACKEEYLPKLVSHLKDLYVSIDFLRAPSSKGVMPPNTDPFQLEVASSYRSLSTFLSFPETALSFTDWNTLTRTVSQLDIALKTFVEAFGE